jgi:hypothetical protein
MRSAVASAARGVRKNEFYFGVDLNRIATVIASE